MAVTNPRLADILIRQGVISQDQWDEAEKHSRSSGDLVADCLVQLEYATYRPATRRQGSSNAGIDRSASFGTAHHAGDPSGSDQSR